MQSYKATFIWSQNEYLKAMQYHYQENMRPAFSTAISVIAAVLVFIGIETFFRSDRDFEMTATAIVFSILGSYWLFFRKKIAEWFNLKKFKKSAGAFKKIEWEFSEDSLSNRVEDVGSADFKWVAIQRAVESAEGFLFYPYPVIFYWLPFSAFEEPADVDRVRDMIQSNKIPYRKIK
jgi:hypothetical protein